jgi:signal transduction histidine kinase
VKRPHPGQGADPGGVAAALRHAAGATRGQFGASLALVALASAASLHLRAYTWLALFLALLLPLAACSTGLLLLQRGWAGARGWAALWIALLLLLPASAALAAVIYLAGLSWVGIAALNHIQVALAEAALVALLLVLPLWMAQHQARALRMAQLAQAALASELKALQAQIEPHFLYNTLANTRYLVRHHPERAVETLDHLIAYLRSALPDLRAPMSTLGRECELAAHYLALMAIRYGERLSVELHCADDARGAALPPLMLMPLVENAVQHGVEPHAGPVTVRVSARRERDQVHIDVRDNGAGVGATVLGSGVGLRNVRQRLDALYGDAAAVSLGVGDDGWTVAHIVMPFAAAADPATAPTSASAAASASTSAATFTSNATAAP